MKKGILLMLLCTLFAALGQFFFKKASSFLSFEFSIIHNYNLFFGFFFYGIGLAIMVIALKYGKLSQLYPIISLNFVWVGLISFFILKETMSFTKVSGIGVIIFGVFMIQKGEEE